MSLADEKGETVVDVQLSESDSTDGDRNEKAALLAGSSRPVSMSFSPPLGSSPSSTPNRSYSLAFACVGCLLLYFLFGPAPSPSNDALARTGYGLRQTTIRARDSLLNRVSDYLPFLSLSQAEREVHPILPLLRHARTQHEKMLARQSTTFAQAVSTYTQRYDKKPPPGFKKWWQFAKERNHTLVDEYDGVMRDLAPFEALGRELLVARTQTLRQLPGVSIISIKDGQAQVHSRSGRWAPALAFQEMIESFVRQLPDMDIAINERLEARILPELRREVKLSEWGETETVAVNMTDPLAQQLPFRADWKRDGSTWEVFRRACPPDSAARRLIESMRSAETGDRPKKAHSVMVAAASVAQGATMNGGSRRRPIGEVALPPSREVTFSARPDSGLDVCSRPSLHTLHSAFFTDTRSIPYLYPLFSPSKPVGFADIRIPSHHYWNPSSEYTYDWELKKGRTRTSADVDWAEKDDKAFWRGKVTRGADTPEGHSLTFQKQRLVTLANDDGSGLRSAYDVPQIPPLPLAQQPRRVLVSVNASTSALVSVSAPLGAVNNVTLDVAMACDPRLGECTHQANLGLRVEPPGPLSEVWKHKYALDLDEVGFSPRFLALMESKCAVVKSTIQREFWSPWAIPWYHYIPLSTSFGELHNIQAFFTGLPKPLVDEAEAAKARAKADKAKPKAGSTKGGSGAGKKGSAKGKGSTTTTTTAAGAAKSEAPQFVAAELEVVAQPKTIAPLDPSHGPIFSGDAALRGIADHGARWRREMVRREDMEVYVFRLLLEYARLVSPD